MTPSGTAMPAVTGVPDRAARRTAALEALGLPAGSLPRHVAIIMDGNGRWATRQDLPRLAGHLAGAQMVQHLIAESAVLGIEAMTLYTFSSENWKRPTEEVEGLMELAERYLKSEISRMRDNGVRFRRIGRREGLPGAVLEALDAAEAATADSDGLTLCLALNYGSRAEITDAVRRIAEDAKAGRLAPTEIDEELISSRLDTAGLPDPDLLIRTAGEMRISNYLLWQISYAELYVTEVPFPEFTVERYRDALRTYAARQRKFGEVR
jgi:undecaprenyl diphosphate synthase